MPEVDGQEKTEQPSQKKLNEGREKGQVARSMEVNSLAIFTSGIMLLYFSRSTLSEHFSEVAIKIFSSLDVLQLTRETLVLYLKSGLLYLITSIIPVFGGLFVVSIAVSVAQVGFQLSPKALVPDLSKFNPIKGIKRLFFSSKSFIELLKSLLKLIVISAAVYFMLDEQIMQAGKLFSFSVSEIADFMINSALALTWKIALVYTIIAAIDFVYQKYSFKKEMMMTKQEVKEENKQSEGDPLVKSRIRRIQYMMAKNRMMQDIPKADVVITNPTHYAVALKYDMVNDSAPKVLAKGADDIAKRIKEVAVKNNIPLHEDVELARALYKYCEVGEFIPAKLFKAVAQILAYVYKLKTGKKRKQIV